MSETLNWNVTATVIGGPTLSDANTVVVDGYDKLAVLVPKAAAPPPPPGGGGGGGGAPAVPAPGTANVTVGPGNWTGVTLLFIKPSKADAAVTFTAGTVTAKLDGPIALTGSGAVSLLGSGAAKLSFSNTSENDITVDILVGRSAS
ncbi:hypothetical protein EC912_103135 [Luteibacter rhizovicinus]|uniref:Uncharacterized protein n=1 Tax=Luteibacter rhizovicinus TaxID=242606 RepID=A0A4R3YQF3_9GAMM|nr:hypothetical protein [Luteibacter rhizovicinus]TCV94650.1 hypothetical protein EC912_103135 [Luteibacter rhizovicinus]